jgi:hypothetical protein
MGRTSDRFLIVLIAGSAALAYVFHEIMKEAVDEWLAVRLEGFGGLFAHITERSISLTFTTALAVIMVWALYARIRGEFADDLKERLRPKFACTFDMADSDCVQVTTTRAAATGAGGGRSRSFRLKIAADRIGSVEGCRARLVSIRRGHETVLDGERLVLPFAPANASDATGKRIDAGVPELLEFLQISDRNTVDLPTVARASATSLKTLLLQPGDYSFVIIISSPESAATATPVLHWSGDWKTASVSL